MKRTMLFLALLVLAATPVLAKDPNFDIEAYCTRSQAGAPKEAYQNCIEEEKAVRDEVRQMEISEAVFNQCLDRAKKDLDDANYYSFMGCAEGNQ